MRDATDKLLRQMRQKPIMPMGAPFPEGMMVPNHSGDHKAGIVTQAPTDGLDIVNKDYVDTNPTTLTAGSIPFSNGAILNQNNANFFWDDSNKRLGIGISTPYSKLEIHVPSVDLVEEAITITSNKLASNEEARIVWRHLTSSHYPSACISSQPGTSYNAGDLRFYTSKNRSLNANPAVIINSNGLVGMGTTIPTATLSVSGSQTIDNGNLVISTAATNTFTTVDGKTVTVSGGIVISIV